METIVGSEVSIPLTQPCLTIACSPNTLPYPDTLPPKTSPHKGPRR